MTVVAISGPERDEILALLPWYAGGTLSRHETARIDAAVAGDAALAREYDVICAELAETIRLNESLGAPGTAVGHRLMAAIGA
jgi:hypothetical protein